MSCLTAAGMFQKYGYICRQPQLDNERGEIMKGYKKYYGRKITWYLITLMVAAILNFVLPRLMPGDPVAVITAKISQGMTDRNSVQLIYEDYAKKFGLDKSMFEQFFIWLKNLFHGDLGVSFSMYPRKVTDVLSSSLIWTVCLQFPAILVGVAYWKFSWCHCRLSTRNH